MDAPLERSQSLEGAIAPYRDGIIFMFNFSASKGMNCRSDGLSSILASNVHKLQRVFEAKLSIQ